MARLIIILDSPDTVPAASVLQPGVPSSEFVRATGSRCHVATFLQGSCFVMMIRHRSVFIALLAVVLLNVAAAPKPKPKPPEPQFAVPADLNDLSMRVNAVEA